jgi:hypothetical protein
VLLVLQACVDPHNAIGAVRLQFTLSLGRSIGEYDMNARTRADIRQAVTIAAVAWVVVAATWIVLGGGWNREIWWHWLFAASAFAATMGSLRFPAALVRAGTGNRASVHFARVDWPRFPRTV